MILNYEFENFGPFKDKAFFSLIAPKTKIKSRFPNNYISLPNGYDVLKTAVLVGENAGGKTNFVRSLHFFKYLFSLNDKVRVISTLINDNNLQTNCRVNDNTSQRFFIEITEGAEIFAYELIIDSFDVVFESLKTKKKKTADYKIVFERKRKDLKVDCNKKNCKNDKCQINNATYVNEIYVNDEYLFGIPEQVLFNNSSNEEYGLLVTKLSILGCNPAKNFIDMINSQLYPETNFINYDIYKAMSKEVDDIQILHDPRFIEIFKMVDFSIISVEIDEEEPFKKSTICRKCNDGHIFKREIAKDSSGVREFFAWAIQIFKVVYMDKVVFADEIDRALNPVLSDRIVAYVNGMEHKGQFVFTTHNVFHLDLRKYMKEQIYFITKDIVTLESEIYSLAEFPEVRYDTAKVYELYLKGILGGTASE